MHPGLLFLLLTGWLAATLPAAELPVLRVLQDDTVVTQSCRIEVVAPIEDRNGNGVLLIRADNLRVQFAETSALRGADARKPWDELRGIGIRIEGKHHVILENLRVHGFKNAVVASRADGLVIDGGDYSDNYRQRLKSTPQGEDGGDWLFPHNNDDTKWRDQYGGAICIESSTNVTVRGVRIRRGQNGIILDRVESARVYDNDCSFLSGWGLAMWRSSRNRITRNAFDFCVRGHVEGVYNRGQDSAGILCFEQCNDNLFAENSVTHGGDGFFGFAGQEAIGERWMSRERDRLRQSTGQKEVDALIQVPPELARSMSALGCNRNLLISNDFSYAPAHGIEMTFSEDNRLVGNRVVENAICGFWGGYSSGTLVLHNEFVGNGGMAYGLERGAINMEHAVQNLILTNQFRNNKCGVHLWWDDDGALLRYPGVQGSERGVVENWMVGNRFELDRELPFRNLRAEAPLWVLQLRDSGSGRVRSNYFFANQVELRHPQARERDVPADALPLSAGQLPPVDIPTYEALGKTRPVGARAHLRGRGQILFDEWGPWDHLSPLVRPMPGGAGEQVFHLLGLRGAPQVARLEGDVTTEVRPAAGASDPGGPQLIIQARSGVAKYRVRVSAEGFERELKGTLIAARWQARIFPWTIDPRKDLAGWRQLAEGPQAETFELSALDLPFGMGGPREVASLKITGKSALGRDHFGLIARTSLQLPKGRWRFRTQSDDGVRVLVDGRPVIENWTWHGPTPNDGEFDQPTTREVPLVVEYFEIDGFATLQLEMEPVPGLGE